MAHHLFIQGSSVLAMKDGAIELVRHFLMVGALQAGLDTVADTVRRWRWCGPGVWVDVETSVLANHLEVFEAATRAVAAFGTSIGVAYLEEHVPLQGGRWHGPPDVDVVTGELRRLEACLRGA